MPSVADNPVDQEEVVVVGVEPSAEVNHETVSSAIAFLLKCIFYIVALLKRTGRLWMDYYPPIFGKDKFFFRSIGQRGFGTLSWHHWLLGKDWFQFLQFSRKHMYLKIGTSVLVPEYQSRKKSFKNHSINFFTEWSGTKTKRLK
ncbi:hypothetical protein L2E82_47689 [Cichorium intybus]|uniref:Uncharacterized protein n=1 Tax=Cichorium intybus TaxID=13427 RepID=A0ACB8YWQ1_CICIN|nr:hypothetical protein L2E82_47689 [Cichorium intybus]